MKKVTNIIDWYASTKEPHLQDLMNAAKALSVEYFKLMKQLGDACSDFEMLHVNRRNAYNDSKLNHIKEGNPVSKADSMAHDQTKDLYFSEYESKAIVAKYKSYTSGIDSVLNRMSQDIARLRDIEKNDLKIDSYNKF